MIIEVNRIEIQPGAATAFEAAFGEAAALLLRVEGCRSASLHRCVEHPLLYQVEVGWDRVEDHVDHYPTTAEAGLIRARLRPFIMKSDPAHFEPVFPRRHDSATATAGVAGSIGRDSTTRSP